MVKMKKIVGIIGLGYVGLPLAYIASVNNYKVIGIDTDEKKVNTVNNKKKIPTQLQELYKEEDLNVTASSDYNKLKEADIIVVCVPTPTIDNKPDTRILENVTESLSKVMKKNVLLIVESTVAPKMTRGIVEEGLKRHNIIINKDYDLAYCPERIDPGNKNYWVGNINRVCGASSKKALKEAIDFYSSIIDAKIIEMNSIEEAELVKVWENSIRNTFIAQSNLLAQICDVENMSVKNVIAGLNSKVEQFPLKIANPGIGPGGHCIPEDIHYLIDSIDIDIDMSLFKDSVNINESMPSYALNKLKKAALNNNDNLGDLNIVMLGISYKPNSDDTRRSQTIVLYNLIKEINKNTIYYDPIVEETDEDLDDILNNANVVIIGCAHDIFLNIDFSKYKNIKYVFDCWNKYNKKEIQELNVKHIGIGE